jgi:cell division protein ZapA
LSPADADRPSPVTVQILDKEYRIACAPEEQYGLMDCARMLDQRMREVRQNGRVIGADRIAVMAALNLVYELMKQRDQSVADVKRLGMLQERIGKALEGRPAPAVAGTDTDPKSGLDASGESV